MTTIKKPNIILGFGGNHRCMFNKRKRTPVLFIKSNNCITGNETDIIVPSDTKYIWAESELAVVISKRTNNVTYEEAHKYIKGYSICNDVNRTNILKRSEDLAYGKCCDTFLPLGDTLISPDTDVTNLRVTSYVNGNIVQDCNTSDLYYDIYKCISYASKYITLEEDDIIITGASAGCRKIHLKDGDIVKVEIEKIGSLINYVKWK